MANSAMWLVDAMLDAQTARDALFPESADSPCILMNAQAWAYAAHQLVHHDGNVVAACSPTLRDFADTSFDLMGQATGAHLQGEPPISRGFMPIPPWRTDAEIELIRTELHQARGTLGIWRSTAGPAQQLQIDRLFTNFAFNTAELEFWGEPVCTLSMIAAIVADTKREMDQAVHHGHNGTTQP